MSKFHQYFLSLSPEERGALASDGDTSVAYLSQIARGHRNPGTALIDQLIGSGRKDVVVMLRPQWFADRACNENNTVTPSAQP